MGCIDLPNIPMVGFTSVLEIPQLPTVATQATTWWESVFALANLIGLGVHLPVKVYNPFPTSDVLRHPDYLIGTVFYPLCSWHPLDANGL